MSMRTASLPWKERKAAASVSVNPAAKLAQGLVTMEAVVFKNIVDKNQVEGESKEEIAKGELNPMRIESVGTE